MFAISSFPFPVHGPSRNFSKSFLSSLFSNTGKLHTQISVQLTQREARERSEERHLTSHLPFLRLVAVVTALERNKTPFTIHGIISQVLHFKVLYWDMVQ